MNDDVVERLETKLAFMEKALNDLSDVVYRQQQEIGALTERISLLSNRFDAFRATDRAYTPEEERPPHY